MQRREIASLLIRRLMWLPPVAQFGAIAVQIWWPGRYGLYAQLMALLVILRDKNASVTALRDTAIRQSMFSAVNGSMRTARRAGT